MDNDRRYKRRVDSSTTRGKSKIPRSTRFGWKSRSSAGCNNNNLDNSANCCAAESASQIHDRVNI